MTIDDLRALMDLLRDRDSGGNRVVVEFGGGEFDDAADLRELSDEELNKLRVKSGEVEVELAGNIACVYGDEQTAHAVYVQWARPRATTRKPSDKDSRLGQNLQRAAVAALASLVVAFASTAVASLFLFYPAKPMYAAILGAFALTFFLMAIGMVRVNRRAWRSHAVILPLSMEELRKDRQLNGRHRQTTTIALLSFSVALLALIASLLWKK